MTNRIICAAIRTKRNVVIRGHRHNDCIRTAHRVPSITQEDITYRTDGFMDSHNQFVDRKEAKAIATESGQVIEDHDIKDLYSEDIY